MHLIKPFVLASRSPRRLTLLRQIGLNPEVAPCTIPEDFHEAASPAENARALALKKAQCVAGRYENALILSADTIVAVDGMMLGKPADESDAKRMLRILSGQTHTVYTAFTILDRPSNAAVTEVEATRVTFRVLDTEEIDEYVAGGSPMDKAGAYGIQDDYSAVFVSRIEGCFYTVVGLPLARFYVALREFQHQLTVQDG